uniref:WD_REPEATS_REGION domain-containing protein n=1 Tax=Caenorhabditis japonica TaxID=281687 RepID=A0A8R1E8B0_CAEJA
MQKQRFGVTENEGLADRKVPKQPNAFSSKDGIHRYNTRKLNELPYHLLRSGDIARVVNPNVDGVFFGLALSQDDKFAAAYTNNNQVIVSSLVTGEYILIEPEPFIAQMELNAGFLVHRDNSKIAPVVLKLPPNVRNIPIRPNHTTTAIAFAAHDSVFVAGVRKNLYLWNVASTELLRSLDAHFGRILNMDSVSQQGQNILISSSLDHTIKIWNMENIFEKSFSVPTMDQAIEKIMVAKNNPTIAAVQTRKNIGIWDIRTIIAIESDQLLLWDLRTQSVVNTLHAPNVFQLFYMNKEELIGIIYRQVDSTEQKVARLTVYNVFDFSIQYNFEYPCRLFKECAVLKGGTTGVVITFFKGHDSLLVFDVIEKTHNIKFRPKQSKKQRDVLIHKIMGMPCNNHQVVVVENDCKASIWDIKSKKLSRYLPQYNGPISNDGRLGLFAPAKGGLFAPMLLEWPTDNDPITSQ